MVVKVEPAGGRAPTLPPSPLFSSDLLPTSSLPPTSLLRFSYIPPTSLPPSLLPPLYLLPPSLLPPTAPLPRRAGRHSAGSWSQPVVRCAAAGCSE